MDKEKVAARFFNRSTREPWEYKDSECFLCLAPLTKASRTKEHVFPKWMLKRHDLWGESMTLLNGSQMRYSQLTIPCCAECNGTHLSVMENKVRSAFDAGYDAVNALDRTVLFSWLAKILYGLLVKERHSLLNLRDRTGAKIISDSDLDRFALHHLLMQTVRGDVNWSSPSGEDPWSIFVLKCQSSGQHPDLNFDYIDSTRIPFLAIRSGEVAIVASLQDWGYLETSIELKHMLAAQQLELHPFQFKELAIICSYVSAAFHQNRKVMMLMGEKQTDVLPLPLPPGATLNIGDPDLLLLAPTLAMHFNTPLEYISDGRRMVTTLSSSDGTPWEMKWDGTGNFPMVTMHPATKEGESDRPASERRDTMVRSSDD